MVSLNKNHCSAQKRVQLLQNIDPNNNSEGTTSLGHAQLEQMEMQSGFFMVVPFNEHTHFWFEGAVISLCHTCNLVS